MQERNIEITRRYKSILQVNEVALTKRTAPAIFHGMCAVLKSLVPCDRALLTVYDSAYDDLQIVDVYGARTDSVFRIGQHLSRNTTQSGWAFEHKATMFRRNLFKERRFSLDKEALEEGYVSVCSVPLLVWGGSIGVVTVASARKNCFLVTHAQIVEEMSKQIALAINSITTKCPMHMHAKLVCPKCIGAMGGQATASKHRHNLSDWGKKGGRGHKRSNLKNLDKTTVFVG
jgi:transcriptional regulator with GAF, ATPase, and Fis domain